MNSKSKEIPLKQYSSNGKILQFDQPLVMAIINLTPDSFYDGGKYSDISDVVRDAEQKITAGAHIIDLGAASSRPGAPEIGEPEEWDRLKNVLPELRKQFPQVFISVDTYRASIAGKSVYAGADIINDIGAGRLDPAMFKTIARLDLPYILMHMDGDPRTMAANPPYRDVTKTVNDFFTRRIEELETLGFGKIILDPGLGFGKSLENNYQLLKHLPELSATGYPLLAGVSRKSMINRVLGTNPVTSLNGTTVLHTICLLNGAKILRVHDVEEAVQAVKLVEFYNNV